MKKVSENCNDTRRRECLKSAGTPANLAMMCEHCEYRDPYVPSDWFQHIWWLFSLQAGGYPFGKDDLSVDEWLAVAEIKSELEAMRAIWQKPVR